MPEQKAVPAPVRTMQATPSSLRQPRERVRQLDAQVDRQRVALLRALQRDDGDVAVRLDRQQSRHGGQPSRVRSCSTE